MSIIQVRFKPESRQNGREGKPNKKCQWLRFEIPCCKLGRVKLEFRVRLNPVVSLLSALIVWGFVVWCVIQAKVANEKMLKWRAWITLKCTWLYIRTQDVWALFIIVLYLSKYSKIKLGKPDDKPQFNDATYFTMLFSAGIGIGLFYFGVGEFNSWSKTDKRRKSTMYAKFAIKRKLAASLTCATQ